MKNQNKHSGNEIQHNVKRKASLRWSFAIAGAMVFAGLAVAMTGRPERGPDSPLPFPRQTVSHNDPTLYPMPAMPDASLDDYDVYLLERARREIESRARASTQRIREGILEIGAQRREAIIKDWHGIGSRAKSVTSAEGYHERVVGILFKHLNGEGHLERLIAGELDQFLYDIERYEQWVLMQSGLYAAEPEVLDRDEFKEDAFLRAVVEALFADYAWDVQRTNRRSNAMDGVFVAGGIATYPLGLAVIPLEMGLYAAVSRVRDLDGRSGIALENGIEELAEGLCFGSGAYPGLYRGMLRVAEGRMIDLEKAMIQAESREARHFHVEKRAID